MYSKIVVLSKYCIEILWYCHSILKNVAFKYRAFKQGLNCKAPTSL
jgi:hypothetical protein